MVRLGAGAEFDLIRALVGGAAALPPGVLLGPGDDCALLAGGAPLAVSVDMSVEGVHFRRGWLTPEEIGWRAAAAALSDLAAMAAEPVGILLSLALTEDDARTGVALELQRGATAAARSVGAAVIGGDLTSTAGPLTLDVVALGRAGRPVLRSGGRPGDELWVTGRLGGAAAAVLLWERGGEPAPDARRAFAHPEPRVREALWLVETGAVRALIDLSDGIIGDAGHIAAASGCRVIVEAKRVPAAEAALAAGADALRLALGGGEDYELCFAVAAGALDGRTEEFERCFGIPLTRVGTLAEGAGVELDAGDGSPPAPVTGGWRHFEGGR